jgi:anti-sigma B factor antagonist
MSAADFGLRIRSEATEDGHVLALAGELDLASAGVLDTAIAELCTDGARRITLDMGELSFMDSTGLRSVLVGRELCEVNDCELVIGELSVQVRRLFDVSGVGTELQARNGGPATT